MEWRLRSVVQRALGSSPATKAVVAGIALCVVVAAQGAMRWGSSTGVTLASVEATTQAGGDEGGSEVSHPKTAGVEDGGARGSESSTSTDEPAELYVHVVGAVLRPGVVRVSEGARIVDAIMMAGGLTGNAAEEAVNLAAPVVDGMQVYVPTQDELAEGHTADPAPPVRAPSATSQGGGSQGLSGPIDVNRASAEELETLPGIGPVTAAAIIAERETNGPFRSVDDLLRVRGIGEKKLDAIRALVVAR
ncbi:MAG: ComEA family DNA-binding protein [Coriobacteriia bacterium]